MDLDGESGVKLLDCNAEIIISFSLFVTASFKPKTMP